MIDSFLFEFWYCRLNFEVTNAAKRAAAKGLVARSKASRWHRYYQLG
jgi:hypothetical protein